MDNFHRPGRKWTWSSYPMPQLTILDCVAYSTEGCELPHEMLSFHAEDHDWSLRWPRKCLIFTHFRSLRCNAHLVWREILCRQTVRTVSCFRVEYALDGLIFDEFVSNTFECIDVTGHNRCEERKLFQELGQRLTRRLNTDVSEKDGNQHGKMQRSVFRLRKKVLHGEFQTIGKLNS